jgi:hypothetical protein
MADRRRRKTAAAPQHSLLIALPMELCVTDQRSAAALCRRKSSIMFSERWRTIEGDTNDPRPRLCRYGRTRRSTRLQPGFAGAKPITLIQTKKPASNIAATAPHHTVSPTLAHATLPVTAKSKSAPAGLGHSRP